MTLQLPFVPVMGAATAAALLVAKYSSLSTSTTLPYALSGAFLFYTIWACYIYPFYLSPMRNVPTVPGFPLWGQFFTIITTEVGVPVREWHEQYGPIVRYFFPFGAERLSIADDDALKHMTVRNPYNYPKPLRAKLWMVRILGEGVLLAEGETHVHQRKALTPAFSIASIRSLAPVFWTKSLHMASLWQQEMIAESAKSKCFEVLEWLNRATLDIIGEAGLGTDISSLDNPETPIRQAYRGLFSFDISSRIYHGLSSFIPICRYLPGKAHHDMDTSRDLILSKATAIIKQKQIEAEMKQNVRQKDIIGLIVRDNMKATAAESLSFETMRDQVMTFLGAGHDTTATAAAWCLMLLSKHTDVQSKLREEIREHMPFLFNEATRTTQHALQADVDLLPYMDDVCREALRFIPSIPMTVRQSLKDDVLGGYTVPAGTTIYVLANAINRLTSFWGPTANQFDPSRWKNLPESNCPNAFMTFLAGPRGCIGRKFAEVEMKTLLCCLLSKFSFEPDTSVQDPEELKSWRLVLRPRDGVSLKVTPVA